MKNEIMKLYLVLLVFGLAILSCGKEDLNTNQNRNEFGFFVNSETNISDLNLAGLETIKGGIQISNTKLKDLSFLKGIKCIEGVLRINHNNELLNLEGLDNLECVDEIQIQLNSKLEDISAINNLNITNTFVLYQNKLESISTMSNLMTLTGNLTIDEPLLNNLLLLENLREVDGELTIVNNEQIENLDKLSNLTQLGTKINIFGNQKLENYCGLKVALANNSNIESIIQNNKENPTVDQILILCE